MRRQESGGFINHFYDDEAWWALAWIGALDNTGRKEYLDEAIAIWYDMTEAWGRPTCGGIPWNKDEDAPALAIQNGESPINNPSTDGWLCSKADLEQSSTSISQPS